MKIRVLLADDHKIVRDGLRNLLEAQPDIDVIAEAENGRMAVELAEKLSPGIVIIDIAMPGLNGIEATRQMLRHDPTTKIIALSMHSDRRFVGEMLKAGASGYLLKDCAFEELVAAIRAVLSDNTYLSPMIGSVIVDSFVRRPQEETASAFSLLTRREREVLQLLAEGKNTKEIADRLYVSVKTVETHRTHIMEKVQVRTVAELTKYAIREGLTSL